MHQRRRHDRQIAFVLICERASLLDILCHSTPAWMVYHPVGIRWAQPSNGDHFSAGIWPVAGVGNGRWGVGGNAVRRMNAHYTKHFLVVYNWEMLMELQIALRWKCKLDKWQKNKKTKEKPPLACAQIIAGDVVFLNEDDWSYLKLLHKHFSVICLLFKVVIIRSYFWFHL